MGFLQTLSRWRVRDDDPAPAAAPPDEARTRHAMAGARREQADRPRPSAPPAPSAPSAPSAPPAPTAATAAPTPVPLPPVVPAPVPPTLVASPPVAAVPVTRVVGSAQLAQLDPELPAFYTGRHATEPAAKREADRRLVHSAWELVRDRYDQLIRQFYAELFWALGDDALRMFPPDMSEQRAEFGRVLVQWVSADDPDALAEFLAQLGADHRKFGAEPRHYELVGQALVTAWSTMAGAGWTPEIEEAVIASYVRVASLMIDGALQHQHEPASWGASVVGHERVRRDLAVVRLQPDEPYAFQPGQYLTVELDRLPRIWRAMSIASAPRKDNSLDLYVRDVSATGVSGALVMHTRVGDRVRLGSPRGVDLVLGAGASTSGLLCICSGTGVAPISAVLEAMLARPGCPPVYAFVGARTGDDLYAVQRLRRLAEAAGRPDLLRVHGVVSDDAEYPGYRGRVEQVGPQLRNWAELGFHAVVAGPNPMIATTVRSLTDAGMPPERIHFDQYDLPA